MLTVYSKTGKKGVHIRYNAAQENFSAAFVQFDPANNREQLIKMKYFRKQEKALEWGNRQLGFPLKANKKY